MPGVIRDWLCFLFNQPPPRPKTPLPANWDEWSPLARDLWYAIDAPCCDRAAIDAVMERHAPEVVRNCSVFLADACGATHEAELYA